MLNSSDDQKKDTIKYLERHMATDEVFVLLKGKAFLITGGTNIKPDQKLKTIKLEQDVFYNVTKATWHSTIMERGSKILIVENRDTGDKNSELYFLTDKEKSGIRL